MTEFDIIKLDAKLYDLRCEILMDKHVQFFRRYFNLSAEQWFNGTRECYRKKPPGDGDPVTAKIKEYLALERHLQELTKNLES